MMGDPQKTHAAFAALLSICFVTPSLSWCLLLRIAMETYIRQRQLIMSPLIPSRVIGENEPLTAVFNKVITTREVNHKGQGKTECSHTACSTVTSEGALNPPLWFDGTDDVWEVCRGSFWCLPHWIYLHVCCQGCLWPWSSSQGTLPKSGRTTPT